MIEGGTVWNLVCVEEVMGWDLWQKGKLKWGVVV